MLNALARLLGIVLMAGTLLVAASDPIAAAQCPDVEVVFARGTAEPPGVGGVGQAFVDAVRAQAQPRSVNVYPVNYAASSDFGDRIQFARTVIDGIRDAGQHIETTASNCPDTQIVLGGFSQGAALAGYVTSAEIPSEIPPEYRSYLPDPMPEDIADHVAAVVLIGMPSERFLRDVGAPPVRIGPAYADKTLEMCAPDDNICNGAPVGGPSIAHAMYGVNGMAAQAAAYAVARLK
ncbi:phospholipase/Carboxylesterase family protein [Mycolicibacterium hassiacum DSM 44199]|uniref:Phospholipase/Carboxylesterase family protein n=2 Tax=Mycolicibacterium hassiacum TaxID=46351 RepID=K5BAI3_MYCHD|nr:cutinase family protein [Mycolicibacterium hassiacum]EKF22290.1 phospholipase/Carboxylesterase family protein [Mycolicibacterium hassiacum DSM 44199]MDA4087437.1 cutinase [Mycolicibacterium hassiacum DSM 44199]VCT91938.1 putative cutinase [Mycolicibacterium hassiacum DSM 44199]